MTDEQEALVINNIGTAKAVVRDIRGGNMIDRQDYMQIARLGLVIAATRYDASRGVKYNTYAYRTARGMILRRLYDIRLRKQILNTYSFELCRVGRKIEDTLTTTNVDEADERLMFEWYVGIVCGVLRKYPRDYQKMFCDRVLRGKTLQESACGISTEGCRQFCNKVKMQIQGEIKRLSGNQETKEQLVDTETLCRLWRCDRKYIVGCIKDGMPHVKVLHRGQYKNYFDVSEAQAWHRTSGDGTEA